MKQQKQSNRVVKLLVVAFVVGMLYFSLQDVSHLKESLAKKVALQQSEDESSGVGGVQGQGQDQDQAAGAFSLERASSVSIRSKFGKFKKQQIKIGPPGTFFEIPERKNFTVCGVTYAEEPSVRVITEKDHRCKCYANHCNELDYPMHSYILLGATTVGPEGIGGGANNGKDKGAKRSKTTTSKQQTKSSAGGSESETSGFEGSEGSESRQETDEEAALNLRQAMEKVYSTQSKTTTVETIVHSSGLRYPAYNTLMQSLVSNKVDRDGYMRNSFLLFTESGRKPEDLRDGLIRFANGLQVSVSSEKDGFKTLGSLDARESAHSVPSSQECKKMKYDNTFIIQYFKRPRNVVQIVKRLKAQKGKNEILINNDSGTEVGVWIRELEKGDPIRYTVLVSGNIHEIRGYNRLAKMAQGKLLVLLQDDDYPSYGGRWLRHAHHLFNHNAKLGLVGGFTGTIQGGPMTNKYGVGRAPIKFKSGFRQPFMFATLVNMGPFIIRRSYFLESGMFNGNFSCRGEAGIGFDYEFALRTWYLGYHVGVFKSEMNYHVGNWASSGTRRNRGLYKKRQGIERRNTRYHKGTYGPRDPKVCPDCLDFYYRQGLHGRANQFSTPYNKLKGVGVIVHDLNYALKKNATKF